MFDELSNKAKAKMDDTIISFNRDLDSISTGRANANALDPIKAEVYGALMPITQLASVSTPDASTISVQVWDKDNVKPVEKGIITSNLGFNPMVDGQLIRISIPKLSQERRIELAKLAKKYAEDKKVAIRNIRRDILDEAKKSEKEFGKDKIHAFTDIAQKITDDYVSKIDELLANKEKELMKV